MGQLAPDRSWWQAPVLVCSPDRVQMPLQCLGLAVVSVGQALLHDWPFGLEQAHREINTYCIGQLFLLILFLDNAGEYQARPSRVEVVTGDAS
ncbi:hypothetical protein ACGFZQ_36300 [Streptomyces sp. NPDC048254]|uniref:hypothetical protein n=1 Tax=Streptomyces sp. NPDC048254 TaxID=3365525 RepID=UPI0037151977